MALCLQPPKGGAFILALVLQAAAFTAAQAVGAVEDTACLPTPWTLEPCAPAPEPRRGETELNEQRAELALIIASDEQHAARLGDNAELADPVRRGPRDRRNFAGLSDGRWVEHVPATKIGKINASPFLDLRCGIAAGLQTGATASTPLVAMWRLPRITAFRASGGGRSDWAVQCELPNDR